MYMNEIKLNETEIEMMAAEIKRQLGLSRDTVTFTLDDLLKGIEGIGGTIQDVSDEFSDVMKTGDNSFSIRYPIGKYNFSNNNVWSKRYDKYELLHKIVRVYILYGYRGLVNQFNRWNDLPSGQWLCLGNRSELGPRECHKIAHAILFPKYDFEAAVARNTKSNKVNLKEIAEAFDTNVSEVEFQGVHRGYWGYL